MKKIIVPTDFSDQASYALNLAVELATKGDVEITLVHVVEIPKEGSAFLGSSSIDTEATLAGDSAMENVFILKLIKKRELQFNEILNDPKYANVNLKGKFLRGTPFHEIGEVIGEINADLIIMGTTGVNSWSESMIGSTAEKVVRHAGCPVLTLRDSIRIHEINRMVLASDFKDDFGKYKLLPGLIREMFDAELHLVYVNTPGHFLNTREIMVRMNDFMESRKLDDVRKHVYCHQNPVEGIIAFAEDNDMDLVMMATSGERSGIFKLFDHSIAEDVVNHSVKPVITFNLHK